MTMVAPEIPDLPSLSRAARTATHQHEVANTIMHSALRRDFARAARMLAARPDPKHRRALAAHLQWMLGVLHSHHTIEDDVIWPAVLRRRPELAGLVDAMEAEHIDLAQAARDLRDAATTWSYDGADRRRQECADALDRLVVVLDEHLRHEEDEAMPLICSVLTEADWKTIEVQIDNEFPTAAEKARIAYWCLDGLDARRERIFLRQVPKVLVVMLRVVYFGRETKRAAALWA